MKKQELWIAILHTNKAKATILKKIISFFNPMHRNSKGNEAKIIKGFNESVVIVRKSIQNNQTVYIFVGWPSESTKNEDIKEALYLLEQDYGQGQYFNKRDQFDKDFERGTYEPSRQICFSENDVELKEIYIPENETMQGGTHDNDHN